MDDTWFWWNWLRGYWQRRSLRWQLHHHMLEQITVATSGGTVVGTLIAIGSDYLELIESSGDRVLVPLVSVEAFSS